MKILRLSGKEVLFNDTRLKERSGKYTHALHMPTLNANLVSVSALDNAGLTITFQGGKRVVKEEDGTVVLTGRNINGMYLLETLDNSLDVPLAMSSLSQLTSLKQWHQRLAHCSPLTIKEMATNNLVSSLNISEMTVDRKCENCILGHQTHCPFDGETKKDLALLELVAFDLWRPSSSICWRKALYDDIS